MATHESLALAVVAVAALFLILLGTASLVAPARARGFLMGFAGSASKHYLELAVRFLVGGAFLLAAPHMHWPDAFRLFGGVLLATTAGLLLVPWRWHDRFARQAVPRALRFLPLLGVSSLALGALVLWALVQGPRA